MFKSKCGAFSSVVNINYRFAIRIPKGIPAVSAGPLLCAGQAVFSPFRHHDIRPGEHVAGVVGVGGIGRLAIMFAKAWGCKVSAISGSPGKKEEAATIGATNFVVLKDPESIKANVGSMNYVIICTAPGGSLDFKVLSSLLAPNGKLIIIGAAFELTLNGIDLLLGQKSVCGSAASSSGGCMEMLDFCALHGVRPLTEVLPMSEINTAIMRLKKGDVKGLLGLMMKIGLLVHTSIDVQWRLNMFSRCEFQMMHGRTIKRR
eukprot:Nk52_evm14s247 gene=Nk52_evmTU14s247